MTDEPSPPPDPTPSGSPPPTDGDAQATWRALAEKYEALHALRVRRDEDAPHPPREELRRWSQAFPGCLRELDRLSAGELANRAARLRTLIAAANAGDISPPPPPWLPWIIRYHALLREELGEPRAPRKSRAQNEAVMAEPAGKTRQGSPRTGPAVRALRALAREIGVEEGVVAAVLFPPRR
jgi:hypothetical protein